MNLESSYRKQETLENLHFNLRSIVSHAMLGDDHAAAIERETFDLVIDELEKFIIEKFEPK